MSSDKSTSKLLMLAYKEEDKKSGYSKVVNFIVAGNGVVINTSTVLKDSTGRYSISESSIFVPDVYVSTYEKSTEENGLTSQMFLTLVGR